MHLAARYFGIGLVILGWASLGLADDTIPIHGEIVPELKPIDDLVCAIMREENVPGVSLAIGRGGKLAAYRGYGWADIEAKKPVTPQTLFGLASVSKAITAAAILRLADMKKLSLDDKAIDYLAGIEPVAGDARDPRFAAITLAHLLYHEGGWDRTKSGEPREVAPRLARQKRVPVPESTEDLIRLWMGKPLDFAPGTEAVYSNFGYAILGVVVERVAKKPYESAVRELVFEPMGLHERDLLLNVRFGAERPVRMARRYAPSGALIERDGHWEYAMASGGWLSSSVELVAFLDALEPRAGRRAFLEPDTYRRMIERSSSPIPERKNGARFGMGWDVVRTSPMGTLYRKGGGLAGVHSLIEHTPEGINWAILWNGGRPESVARFRDEMPRALRKIDPWPAADLRPR